MQQTNESYEKVVQECRQLFLSKVADYGTSWRLFRPLPMSEQLLIKALRIREIQELGKQKVDDPIRDEFIGLVNYGIVAVIQNNTPAELGLDLDLTKVTSLYDAVTADIKALMLKKNHDYGEAWRKLSQQSFVDLILVKLARIKQIIINKHQVKSEGVDANYYDIVNYAIFALIMSVEQSHSS